MEAFNRYSQRKLVIDDARIAGVRIGGAFRKTDPESFIQVLSVAWGVQARFETAARGAGAGTFHLTRAPSLSPARE